MAGMSNTEEAAVLDARLDVAGNHLALSSTAPADDGTNVTEPSGGGYSRVSIGSADWNAAVAGAPTVKDNSATFTFPTATADWVSGSNLTHFAIYDAATGGNMLYSGALDTAKPVLNGDTAEFGAGDVDVKLGDPSDTF